jgi:hypothetical protein
VLPSRRSPGFHPTAARVRQCPAAYPQAAPDQRAQRRRCAVAVIDAGRTLEPYGCCLFSSPSTASGSFQFSGTDSRPRL